jgi:hypothetical protein
MAARRGFLDSPASCPPSALHADLCRRGFDPAFKANYRQVAKRLSAGEGIQLVSGPDDICAPLLAGSDPHCLGVGAEARDVAAAEAIAGLLGREIAPGSPIKPDAALLQSLRTAFASGEIRSACHGCEWEALCSRVAGHGYPGILVDPS